MPSCQRMSRASSPSAAACRRSMRPARRAFRRPPAPCHRSPRSRRHSRTARRRRRRGARWGKSDTSSCAASTSHPCPARPSRLSAATSAAYTPPNRQRPPHRHPWRGHRRARCASRPPAPRESSPVPAYEMLQPAGAMNVLPSAVVFGVSTANRVFADAASGAAACTEPQTTRSKARLVTVRIAELRRDFDF